MVLCAADMIDLHATLAAADHPEHVSKTLDIDKRHGFGCADAAGNAHDHAHSGAA